MFSGKKFYHSSFVLKTTFLKIEFHNATTFNFETELTPGICQNCIPHNMCHNDYRNIAQGHCIGVGNNACNIRY